MSPGIKLTGGRLPTACRGFTLIEIMVVVTIIGIMTGIIAVNVISQDPQKLVDKEILRLKAVLEMAQEEALFGQQEIGVIVDEEGYKFARWGIAGSAEGSGAGALDPANAEALKESLSQAEGVSQEEAEQIAALAENLSQSAGGTLAMLASSGLSMSSNNDGFFEWHPYTGERTFRDYELDEDYEIILEVDHEQIDLTGGIDEETLEAREEAKAAEDILEEEEEEELLPSIFVLSSGELSPFVLEIRLRDDGDIVAKLSGDETGRLWIGDDDESESDDDF